VIPGLTDHETPKIIQAAAQAGASCAGFVPVRLPFGVKELFADWLERNFPDRKDKVLNHIRELRGGKLNDPNFGSRMGGHGPLYDQLRQMFHLACRKAGIDGNSTNLSSDSFKRPPELRPQLDLFPVIEP
jgi:DNA repair photolyase